MTLSKDDIIKGLKLKHEDVEIKGLGKVRLRELTAGEFDQYQKLIIITKGDKVEVNQEHMSTALLSLCLVDENDKPMFTQAELKELPARPLRKLNEAAQRLNGETDETEKN
jgi:hypothetical protein